MECERCGAMPTGFNLFDYCAICHQNLCAKCMENGCCGEAPALSGMAADYPEEADSEE